MTTEFTVEATYDSQNARWIGCVEWREGQRQFSEGFPGRTEAEAVAAAEKRRDYHALRLNRENRS